MESEIAGDVFTGGGFAEGELRGGGFDTGENAGARLIKARNLTRSQLCEAAFDRTTVFPDESKGHTKKDVCADGVSDDAFGLTPPGMLPKFKEN